MSATPSFTPVLAPGAPERMAVIDLNAVRHNVRHLKTEIGERTLIAVVKADAYGHGAIEVGRAALEAGADMLGVAHIREGLSLRRAGIDAPLLAWMHTLNSDFSRALTGNIELGVSGWDLDAVAETAQKVGTRAVVHIKVDTGLGRNGCTLADLPALLHRAREYEEQNLVTVRGVFTHLAVADEPARTETLTQLEAFNAAVNHVRQAGLNPELFHIANTPGTLMHGQEAIPEELLGNAVRVGLGVYGLSPISSHDPEDFELQPVMTFQTFINSVKEVPAGQGVSYGLNYRTETPTTLALVPVGYADGIPRVASNASVRIYPAGAQAQTYQVVGRIAMDQMVIDLGKPGLSDPEFGYLGAPVVLFGNGENPSVTEWAEAAGTINYEIVTRISSRVDRVFIGESTSTSES